MDEKQTMTIIQQKVYNAIVSYMFENQYPPSVQELCDITGLKSKSSVLAHLVSLEKKGYIKTVPGTPRAIKVVGIEYSDNRVVDNTSRPESPIANTEGNTEPAIQHSDDVPTSSPVLADGTKSPDPEENMELKETAKHKKEATKHKKESTKHKKESTKHIKKTKRSDKTSHNEDSPLKMLRTSKLSKAHKGFTESSTEYAMWILEDMLSNGPVPANDAIDYLLEKKIDPEDVIMAKSLLGITNRKNGGIKYWILP